jgi:hypothetical protein
VTCHVSRQARPLYGMLVAGSSRPPEALVASRISQFQQPARPTPVCCGCKEPITRWNDVLLYGGSGGSSSGAGGHAEVRAWHRTGCGGRGGSGLPCFRCRVCDKPLTPDKAQVEGTLIHCEAHNKQYQREVNARHAQQNQPTPPRWAEAAPEEPTPGLGSEPEPEQATKPGGAELPAVLPGPQLVRSPSSISLSSSLRQVQQRSVALAAGQAIDQSESMTAQVIIELATALHHSTGSSLHPALAPSEGIPAPPVAPPPPPICKPRMQTRLRKEIETSVSLRSAEVSGTGDMRGECLNCGGCEAYRARHADMRGGPCVCGCYPVKHVFLVTDSLGPGTAAGHVRCTLVSSFSEQCSVRRRESPRRHVATQAVNVIYMSPRSCRHSHGRGIDSRCSSSIS